ncbi:MAG: S8 family serine peptidase [Verrucomicrobiaceae bacterium]|nr:S8 family serine peptidase [Verrucomicrobiaceae bacterium]
MNRRHLVSLCLVAFAVMAVALGWMVKEMQGPELPVAEEVTGRPKKASRVPSPSSVAPVTASQTKADSAAERDLATEMLEDLQHPEAVPGEALLSFKNQAALDAFRARAAQAGLLVVSIDPTLLTARVRYRNAQDLQREVAANEKDYAHAGANWAARIPGLPQQPSKDTANAGGAQPFQSQGLDLIGAPANRTGWGAGVTVAVLDSGVVDHPSLQGAAITHLDLVNDGQDFHGHGTAMTSLIAGSDAKVSGVAPSAKILDVRVADPQGGSNTSLLSSGIVKAVEAGAKVINISLGSTQGSPVLDQAVAYALSRGVVIVAAAGNEQANMLSYPAALPGVVSVGAVDANGKQAWFSNSGQGLSLVAPGVGIVSAYTGNKLVIGSGTSQATALVSGVAAYLAGRGYQPANIPTVLIRSARPTGAATTAVGAGIVRIP